MEQTRRFIGNWILTGPNEKGKSLFDVWDIVLRNYLPNTRPILFRACNRISKKCEIASFTGRIESANRFVKGRGYLMICDTTELIDLDQKLRRAGEYKHTFYPLSSVLKMARDSGGWGFSDSIFNYIGEDEYIMRMNFDNSYNFKFIKSDL
ncbi:MAG: hypothetical protein JXR53_12005 [Bacteroidales bacterium]|nr:hypothetical protein [Bacteroidales bacterium]